jgi:MraZ protein
MFRGRYQHAIDPKGRVSIPARYRDVLAQYDGTMVIVVPNEHALEVYPLREWEAVEERINQQSHFEGELRRLGRLFISRAKEVEVDSAGRILIPPETRQQAGLARDVTLVGPGRKYFEVWDRARFEEYERNNSDALPAGFERLRQLGV